ncbi:hypothetical protein QM012_004876 [Aureobasidium pullulans]|uniref:Succinate dehydrogenase subunit C n=1 Tax=Aureobasidium pullulans TaxID=5580 RepID=A0ABR0TVE8_AURPU
MPDPHTVTPFTPLGTRRKPVLPIPAFKTVLGQSRFQSDKAKIQVLSTKEGQQLLADRRLHRPISPHLGIYKWNMGSIMSSMMRITGVAYSGSFYLFGLAHLVSPYLGWDLSSATIAAAFGDLPEAAKSAIKFAVAWPVILHSINGMRHLTWDRAKGFNNGFVQKTGWAAIGATTLSVGYMVLSMS